MKEGYLQKKIAEFSEKLQDFNHRLNMAETEFERYQHDLGNFKDLLKKLKQVEDFQQKSIETINNETKKLIEDQVLSFRNILEKQVEKVINSKSKMISNSLERIEKNEELLKTSINEIDSFRQNIIYYEEFQRLFILKLINKGILNHQELSEIELRAKKRMKNIE
jgi:hypothetical protein